MARRSTGPWYRKARDQWYVCVRNKNVPLGVAGKSNGTAAVAAWHRLMAQGPPKAEEPRREQPPSVSDLLDRFLAHKSASVRPKTHLAYRCLLAHARTALGTLRPDALTRPAVESWLRTVPLSPNTRHDIAGLLGSALSWARAAGLLEENPLAGLKRPPRTSRGAKAAVSEQTHAKLAQAAPGPLRELLALLRLTGARPGELARLTAADLDPDNGVAVLSEHKTAHKTGRPRVIVLVEAASALLRALAARHPDGPLLRNGAGRGWTKDAIVLAVRRCARRAGVRATAYGYRHGYATAALSAGVPDAQVAALLGHSSTAVLHKHYAHLTSQVGVLRKAAEGVRGPAPS